MADLDVGLLTQGAVAQQQASSQYDVNLLAQAANIKRVQMEQALQPAKIAEANAAAQTAQTGADLAQLNYQQRANIVQQSKAAQTVDQAAQVYAQNGDPASAIAIKTAGADMQKALVNISNLQEDSKFKAFQNYAGQKGAESNVYQGWLSLPPQQQTPQQWQQQVQTAAQQGVQLAATPPDRSYMQGTIVAAKGLDALTKDYTTASLVTGNETTSPITQSIINGMMLSSKVAVTREGMQQQLTADNQYSNELISKAPDYAQQSVKNDELQAALEQFRTGAQGDVKGQIIKSISTGFNALGYNAPLDWDRQANSYDVIKSLSPTQLFGQIEAAHDSGLNRITQTEVQTIAKGAVNPNTQYAVNKILLGLNGTVLQMKQAEAQFATDYPKNNPQAMGSQLGVRQAWLNSPQYQTFVNQLESGKQQVISTIQQEKSFPAKTAAPVAPGLSPAAQALRDQHITNIQGEGQ